MKFLVLSFCLCTFALGQPAISEERIWEDFTAWLQKQAPNSKPGDLIRSYRENLTTQGIAVDRPGGEWVSSLISYSRAEKA
jgi:hypothetical protein